MASGSGDPAFLTPSEPVRRTVVGPGWRGRVHPHPTASRGTPNNRRCGRSSSDRAGQWVSLVAVHVS
jgi:hypothetical protein